jgi:pheromone shutdown protein TraB
MIKIIGTNHLMSKEAIEGIIKDFNPDLIGVELCNTRLNALVINPQPQPQVKDDTVLGKISQAVRKKAEQEKVVYGSDMITASKYALENKIQLEVVDRDIREISELMQKIPQNEVQNFMKAITEFESSPINKQVDENRFLSDLKSNFPISFEFLLTSRELYIQNQILRIALNNEAKRILIFLGKGHEKRIKDALGDLVE